MVRQKKLKIRRLKRQVGLKAFMWNWLCFTYKTISFGLTLIYNTFCYLVAMLLKILRQKPNLFTVIVICTFFLTLGYIEVYHLTQKVNELQMVNRTHSSTVDYQTISQLSAKVKQHSNKLNGIYTSKKARTDKGKGKGGKWYPVRSRSRL